MSPSRSSSLRAATLTVLAFALMACGAESSSADDGDDVLAEQGESELRTDDFAGRWADATPAAGELKSLDLNAGGAYVATIAVCPAPRPGQVSCLAMPRDEVGRYTILGTGNKRTLRLAPLGAAVRRYTITFESTAAGAPRSIELTRAGKMQVLDEVTSSGSGSTSGGVTCGPNVCAVGLVCCSSMRGICARRGQYCAN